MMRVGFYRRPHLVQHDGDAGIGQRPSGFGTGHTAADYVNRFHGDHMPRRTIAFKSRGPRHPIRLYVDGN
jgi:hypothetical protein